MGRAGLKERLTANIREVVFGLEDSFVSTLGAVSGVAVGSGDAKMVMLAGLVIVAVEALSMAAGSYLSSKAATELYDERLQQDAARMLAERVSDKESLKAFFARKGFTKAEIDIVMQAMSRERKLWLQEVRRCEYRFSPGVSSSPLLAAFIMGVFYLAGGSLVLIPYALLPLMLALPAAILITIALLFFLGVWKASIAGVNRVHSGLEMVAVSLTAAVLGIGIGRLFSL